MTALDLALHVMGLFLPALGMALLAPTAAKLLWRRQLAGVPWARLALGVGLAASACLLGGLLITGQDGRMLTYGAAVMASALALWLLGWWRR
jgi:hypothetical protein